jgi:mono/diheme cytochrome c family protein
VLDRATGEFISAKAYTRVNWAKEIDQATGRPVESPEGDYESGPRVVLPGPRGAHSWQPMSFNPRTGLVYIPVDENPEFLMRVPHQRHPPVGFNLGAMDNVIPDHLLWKDWPTGGRLVAWDPATQTERWGVPHVGQWNGGTLTTAGNLVFQGLSNATFGAYRATDGSRLWEAPVVSAIVAPPVSYRVKDRQFVAVTTGWGGGFIRFVNSPGRVYAFTLDGTKLPPRPPRDPPAEPVRHGPDPATVARGELLFKARCGRCHSGGTMLTDLRYSQPGVFDIYPEIVLKGAYQRRGMPQFARFLKEPDVLAIRSYVLDARTRLVEAHRKGPAAAAKR